MTEAPTSMRCTYCGADTHTAPNCPKTWRGQGNRNAMRCTYCGGRDHRHSSCPKMGRARQPDDHILDK